MNRTLVASGLIACAFALGGCTALTDFDGVAADGAIGDAAMGDVPVDRDAGVDGSVERDAGGDAGGDAGSDAGNDGGGVDAPMPPVDAGPITLCARDENVRANMCTPCAFGTFTARNDPASGPDTECDAECATLPCDACDLSLGVPCATFEDAYVKASNTGANDNFGVALAVSGDTMVVGAPLEDSDATDVDGDEENNARIDSGAAYVYVRVDGIWEQQAYLKADNAGAGDRFGASVAIDGDRIVVGAPFEDSNATGVGVGDDGANDDLSNHGAAYVFDRTGDTWGQVAYLKGPHAGVRVAGNGVSLFGDEWGTGVAVSGALVAIGGPKEDSAITNPTNNDSDNCGAVVLFQRGGDGLWSRLTSIKAPNIGSGDFFGSSLALDGTTLVVGASGEDSSTEGVQAVPPSRVISSNDDSRNVGAAYVFVFNGGSWVPEAYLKPSTLLSGTLGIDIGFGRSVAVDGNRVVVGATGEASPASGVDGEEVFTSETRLGGAGAAYVFDRTGRLWTQVAYLKASSPDAGDTFGCGVAVSGEVVAVGACGEDGSSPGVGSGEEADNTASSSGAAYIFRRIDEDWRYLAYVKAAFPDAGDGAGSVALDGSTLAIGAPDEDSSATGTDGDQEDNGDEDSGAVYVRRLELE